MDIRHIIKICEFLDLTDLYNVIKVNKQWCNAGIHCISLFRNIQYKPIDYIYSKWKCSMLKNLKSTICGHNNWFLLYVKTNFVNLILYKNTNFDDFIQSIQSYNENKK